MPHALCQVFSEICFPDAESGWHSGQIPPRAPKMHSKDTAEGQKNALDTRGSAVRQGTPIPPCDPKNSIRRIRKRIRRMLWMRIIPRCTKSTDTGHKSLGIPSRLSPAHTGHPVFVRMPPKTGCILRSARRRTSAIEIEIPAKRMRILPFVHKKTFTKGCRIVIIDKKPYTGSAGRLLPSALPYE